MKLPFADADSGDVERLVEEHEAQLQAILADDTYEPAENVACWPCAGRGQFNSGATCTCCMGAGRL
jgi:hypothetical protein